MYILAYHEFNLCSSTFSNKNKQLIYILPPSVEQTRIVWHCVTSRAGRFLCALLIRWLPLPFYYWDRSWNSEGNFHFTRIYPLCFQEWFKIFQSYILHMKSADPGSNSELREIFKIHDKGTHYSLVAYLTGCLAVWLLSNLGKKLLISYLIIFKKLLVGQLNLLM